MDLYSYKNKTFNLHLSRLWRFRIGSLETDGNLDNPGVGLAVPSRVDLVLVAAWLSPSFPCGKPGNPRASGKAWSVPQPDLATVPRLQRKPTAWIAKDETFAFLLEVKGNKWERGTGGKMWGQLRGSGHTPAHSRLTPRSFLWKCFCRGCLIFLSFFLSFFFFFFFCRGRKPLQWAPQT